MADFIGLLKKTIEAQKNITPQLRERVYARAREAVGKKLSESNIPEAAANQQIDLLEKSIVEVEAEYQKAEKALLQTIMRPSEPRPHDRVAPKADIPSTPAPIADAPRPAPSAPTTETARPAAPSAPKAATRPPASAVSQPNTAPAAQPAKPHSNMHAAPTARASGSFASEPVKSAPNIPDAVQPAANIPAENIIKPSARAPMTDAPREKLQETTLPKTEPAAPTYEAAPALPDNPDFEVRPTAAAGMAASAPAIEPKTTENKMATEKVASSEAGNKSRPDLGRLDNIFKTQSERKALAEAKRKRKIFWAITCSLIALIALIVLLVLKPFSGNVPTADDKQKQTENASVQTEKQTQRLLPDGSETSSEPNGQPQETTYPKSDTEATAIAEQANTAKATLYMSQTPSQTEKVQTGETNWIIGRDISESGRDLGPIIRGDVTVPLSSTGQKFIMRMTIRPNHDESIPATYITSAIFVTPDDFTEGPVDEILDFKLKATEQNSGQQMVGTTNTKIGDNFFIFPMSSAGPFSESNLRLLRQMPWIRIVARFKSGRIMELTFNKGEKGKDVFDKVIGEWLGEQPSSR